jgi:hypothetical protein
VAAAHQSDLSLPASPSEKTDAQQGDTSQISRSLKRDIYARIHTVIKNVQPFHISLNAESAAGTFRHKKDSQTVWLKPSSDSAKELQAALQAEFSECTADDRPFTPHLSVGGAKSDEAAAHLREDIRKSIIEFVSSNETEPEEQARAILNLNVDKVFVIERRDFCDRFKVVGVVGLGEE